MLLIRSKFLRFSGAFLAAATLLSADLFAAQQGWGGHHGGGNGNWGGGGWWGWCGTGDGQTAPPAETPEINPALAGAAITLLLGGALILTDMLRNKKRAVSN